jgi:hypothetical protein
MINGIAIFLSWFVVWPRLDETGTGWTTIAKVQSLAHHASCIS